MKTSLNSNGLLIIMSSVVLRIYQYLKSAQHYLATLAIILMVFFVSGELKAQNIVVTGFFSTPTASHPDSCNFITPCYDQIELRFHISHVVTSTALLSPQIVLQFPLNYVDFSFGTPTFADSDSNCNYVTTCTSFDNATNCSTTIKFDSSYNCTFSGDWVVKFKINNCDIYDANDFRILFNMSLQNSNDSLIVIPNEFFSVEPQTIRSTDLLLNLDKTKIEIDTTNLPIGHYTQNGKYFTKFEAVDRYYKIQTQEGISDYFKLRMSVEADAEIMLIEAIDGNYPDSSLQVIYNNPNIGYGLQGGSVFNVVFGNTLDTSIYIPNDLVPDTTNSIALVGANLEKCITQIPIGSTDSVLYHYNRDSLGIIVQVKNYILIHERLRLKELNNCSFQSSSTGYELAWYCNNNVISVNDLVSCQTSNSSLDIRGDVFKENVEVGQYVQLNGHYDSIPQTGAMGVCSNSVPIDYAVVIKNSCSTSNPNLPKTSGTIELKGIGLIINRNYFDYDGIYLGTHLLDTSKYTSNIDANGFETILIHDSAFAFSSNPNFPGDALGLDSIVHGQYPLPGQELFQYLPVGHRIGFTFHNLIFLGDRDSSILNALQNCGTEFISLLGTTQVFYKSMCHLEDTVNQIWVQDRMLLSNGFTGYGISNAMPQDVGTMGDTSVVHASFVSTSSGLHVRHPWQLSNVHNPVDLFTCNSKTYGALINLPSANFSLPDTIYYSDPLDTSGIGYICHPEQIDSSLNYRVNFPLITSPSVDMDFIMHIICQDSISKPVNFTINFIETCDTNCSSCYINYGCTDFVLNLHCNGECESYVQTDEFKMERTSFGWADFADWDSAHITTPSVPPLGVLPEAKYKYYPFDKVHVRSENGSIGGDSGVGLIGLDSLFFDMSFDSAALPVAINPLTLIDGSFKIYGTNPVSGCLGAIDTLIVSVNPSLIFFIPGIAGDSLHPSIIRIMVDLNTPLADTSCGSHKLIDILRIADCKIDFSGDFYFNDLDLDPGYFPVANITGQYSCVYANVFSGSCDPYMQHLTYLKLNIGQQSLIIGAKNWTFGHVSQCTFLHETHTLIEGGFPNADDFIDEYRPVIVYPKLIKFNLGNNITLDSGYFSNIGFCSSAYTFHPINDTINLSGSTCNLAIEKTPSNDQQLTFIYEKNCANLNTTDSINYDGFEVQRFAYVPDCITCQSWNIDDSTFSYRDSSDIYNVSVDYTPSGTVLSPYIGIKNPTDDIEMQLSFVPNSPSFTSGLPHCFLYFPDSLLGNKYVSMIVKNNSGTVITPFLYGSEKIYDIGAIPNDQLNKKKLKLQVDWKQCDIEDSVSYSNIIITSRILNTCSGILDSTTFNTCQFAESTFFLKPEKANVTLQFSANNSQNVSGCQSFTNDFSVKSLGSTLKNAYLEVVVPSNLDLDLANCRIDNDSVPLIPSVIVPTLSIDSTTNINYRKYTFNLVNYIPLNSFYKGSLNEIVLVHLAAHLNGKYSYPVAGQNSFSITCNVLGVSGCGDTVREVNQSYQYNYSSPPNSIVISGDSTICYNNQVVLSASYMGSTAGSYTWIAPNGVVNGNYSYLYNAIYPGGTYIVTRLDPNGCHLYASKTVSNSSIAVSISAKSPNVPCVGSPDTLNAIAIPSAGCTYLWSNGATTASVVVNPLVNSTYWVIVTSPGGCTATAQQSISINSTSCCGTGIQLDSIDFTGTKLYNAPVYSLNQNVTIPAGAVITLSNTTVNIGAGVQITIALGGQLNLSNTILQGCSSMWSGIVMMQNSGFSSTDINSIRDANAGIEVAGDTTRLNAVHISFENCVRGIFFSRNIINSYIHASFIIKNCVFKSTPSGFLTDYLNQPTHGSIPYCGIDIRYIIGNIGVPGTTNTNRFEGLFRGIVSEYAKVNISNVTCNNIIDDPFYRTGAWPANHGRRSDGSCAIYGSSYSPPQTSILSRNVLTITGDLSANRISPVQISNSVAGVITEQSNLYATDVECYNVDVGILAKNNNDFLTSEIKTCRINARLRGISYINNAGAHSTLAEHNIIHIVNPSGGMGISVNEILSGGDGNYNIRYNTITIDGSNTGIFVSNMLKGFVQNNYIELLGSNSFPHSFGIQITGGLEPTIKCNNVQNSIPGLYFTNTTGLLSGICTNPIIQCNGLFDVGTGAYFGGMNDGTRFIANEMSRNLVGLQVGSSGLLMPAVMGAQIHNGNKWINYVSPFGAINFGNENDSKFFTNTSMGQVTGNNFEYYPELNQTNFLNHWFTNDPSGTPATCIHNPLIDVCHPIISDTIFNDDEVARQIASGTLDTNVYNAETINQARLYLYKRLLDDEDLLKSDQIFPVFMDEFSANAIGELSYIDSALATLNSYSYSINISLSNLDTLQRQLTDSLNLLFQNGIVNEHTDSIQFHIMQLELARKMIFEGIRGGREASLDLANQLNNLTSPTHSPEENKQMVNEFYILYQNDGIDGLELKYNEILAIAQLCPYQGGTAVYQARALLELFNDSLEYDDDAVCLMNGIYREGSPIDTKELFLIYPNPAKNEVQVSLINSNESIKSIQINDLLSKEVFHCQYSSKSRNILIDISTLASGSYLILVESSSGFINVQKLSIIH